MGLREINEKNCGASSGRIYFKAGSIDSRHVSEHTPQEGSRLHRMLQKEAGSLYQKEVSLKIEVPLNGHNYCVEGRADGIFVKETGQVVIDEIKTSEPAFEELPPERSNCFGIKRCVMVTCIANKNNFLK